MNVGNILLYDGLPIRKASHGWSSDDPLADAPVNKSSINLKLTKLPTHFSQVSNLMPTPSLLYINKKKKVNPATNKKDIRNQHHYYFCSFFETSNMQINI